MNTAIPTKPLRGRPRTSIKRGDKLFCPTCGGEEPRQVTNVSVNPFRRAILTLACGHKRSEFLAARQGSMPLPGETPKDRKRWVKKQLLKRKLKRKAKRRVGVLIRSSSRTSQAPSSITIHIPTAVLLPEP
jgi:hypothetical protein